MAARAAVSWRHGAMMRWWRRHSGFAVAWFVTLVVMVLVVFVLVVFVFVFFAGFVLVIVLFAMVVALLVTGAAIVVAVGENLGRAN